MPLESLAKIFGPTIVGHASVKPDPSVQWKDAEKQPKVTNPLAILGTISPHPDWLCVKI